MKMVKMIVLVVAAITFVATSTIGISAESAEVAAYFNTAALEQAKKDATTKASAELALAIQMATAKEQAIAEAKFQAAEAARVQAAKEARELAEQKAKAKDQADKETAYLAKQKADAEKLAAANEVALEKAKKEAEALVRAEFAKRKVKAAQLAVLEERSKVLSQAIETVKATLATIEKEKVAQEALALADTKATAAAEKEKVELAAAIKQALDEVTAKFKIAGK